MSASNRRGLCSPLPRYSGGEGPGVRGHEPGGNLGRRERHLSPSPPPLSPGVPRERGVRSSLFACFMTALALVIAPSWCRAGDVAFRPHVINADSEFMAAAAFDVNKDGKLDIV